MAAANMEACGRPAIPGIETTIYDETSPDYIDAKGRLDGARKDLRGPHATLARAYIRDAREMNAMGKLSRYETQLAKDLERTLNQL